MRKLIVSWDAYSWVIYCSTMLEQDTTNQYTVMICNSNDTSSMAYFDRLCDDAIIAQRRYDIFRLGKEFNIQRLEGMSSSHNVESLITYIQLQILVGGIKEIYFQYDVPILKNVFSALRKRTDIPIYGYNPDKNIVITYELTQKDILRKRQLIYDYMVGLHNEYYGICPTKETFGGSF